MPCMLCNDGSNAIFEGWDIVSEGTLEVLCARYSCASCNTPTWVQVGIREADDFFGDDEFYDPGKDAPGSSS